MSYPIHAYEDTHDDEPRRMPEPEDRRDEERELAADFADETAEELRRLEEDEDEIAFREDSLAFGEAAANLRRGGLCSARALAEELQWSERDVRHMADLLDFDMSNGFGFGAVRY